MMELPDLHELTWLFEADPVLLDVDVPVFYNTVTYTVSRGDDRIVCAVRPASDEVDLVWSRGDQEMVTLALSGVAALRVLRDGGREVLRVSFSEARLQPLHLRIKPTVHLAWQV